MPTIPKTNMMQAMIMSAYGNTSPFKEAMVADLTFCGTSGSCILKAVCLICPDISKVMLSIAGLSNIVLKEMLNLANGHFGNDCKQTNNIAVYDANIVAEKSG